MYRKHKPALYTYLQTLLIEPNIFKYYRERNIQVTFFIFQNSPFILFSSYTCLSHLFHNLKNILIWLRPNFVNYSYIFKPGSFHYQLLHAKIPLSCHSVTLKQKKIKNVLITFSLWFLSVIKKVCRFWVEIVLNTNRCRPGWKTSATRSNSCRELAKNEIFRKQ